ncbi:MAG TPA: DUF2069 domain-containing protein [Rhodanobacteraceae bacterium]|nr:DUF2069 domain-containing protein [Rhodanobacteraceae bacterium]
MTAERFGAIVWALLIALQFAWYLLLAPPKAGSPWLALTFALPILLLPLLAHESGWARVLFWCGIAALFYFCHGVVAAWVGGPETRFPAISETVLSVVLIGTVGWIGRRDKRKRA